MALSKPARREHIHTRSIRCRGFRREDGLWDIEAELEDVKSYSFDNVDRGGIMAGEPIHLMHIRLTVDNDLVVRETEATTERGPFDLCGAITPVFQSLVGLQIGPGWRKRVMARMGATAGCTHLTELLLGPLTTTTMQTVLSARRHRQEVRADGRPPPILDTCHALARTSPVVARHWPQYHRNGTGEEDSAETLAPETPGTP